MSQFLKSLPLPSLFASPSPSPSMHLYLLLVVFLWSTLINTDVYGKGILSIPSSWGSKELWLCLQREGLFPSPVCSLSLGPKATVLVPPCLCLPGTFMNTSLLASTCSSPPYTTQLQVLEGKEPGFLPGAVQRAENTSPHFTHVSPVPP